MTHKYTPADGRGGRWARDTWRKNAIWHRVRGFRFFEESAAVQCWCGRRVDIEFCEIRIETPEGRSCKQCEK
jgi:hypothetical protein